MKFLEATFIERSFPGDPLLELVRQATIAINAAIRIMYKADLWLTSSQSFAVAGNGLRFLRRYEVLARQSMDRNLNLFEFAPKIHPLQKIFLRLHWGSEQNIEQLNPLSVSVQQCEDFIGRPSRLSRRVASGQITTDRVLNRYLMACYPQWIAAGFLIRPVWPRAWKISQEHMSPRTWNLLHVVFLEVLKSSRFTEATAVRTAVETQTGWSGWKNLSRKRRVTGKLVDWSHFQRFYHDLSNIEISWIFAIFGNLGFPYQTSGLDADPTFFSGSVFQGIYILYINIATV